MICRYKIKFISDIEQKIRKLLVNIAVAPFVGVWIEMSGTRSSIANKSVAPFVGVWIEIPQKRGTYTLDMSLPLWECGLKSCLLAGYRSHGRRSLCGSVD
mgnify:CR=1 FL=1